MIGSEVVMPATACINCGHISDRATALQDDVKPAPGDVTICIECGHLMVFADDLSFRNPNSEELKRIAGDPLVVAAMTALDRIKRESKQ